MSDFEEYLLLEQKVKGKEESTIHGVPLWKLIRTHFRWKYRDTRPFTVKPNIQLSGIIRNSCVSLWGITKIYLCRKKYDNVFFPHPRLFYVNEMYMERFSDSLIESAGIQNRSVIFERHQNGIHKRPRFHSEMVVYLDMVDNLTMLLSPIVKMWIKRKYKKQVLDLYGKLNNVFKLNDASYIEFFYNSVSQFVISRKLIKPLLNCISPKRIFFAPRGTYSYAVSICKEKGIQAIELEHGIVIDQSDLYTGEYDSRIDPDYFFVWGADNVGTQYGMPIERVINIGFPFKDFITSVKSTRYKDNTCLVISEPEITDIIIEVLIEIIKTYPDYVFHIRCHPQEKLSRKQLQRIKCYTNIQVVDNTLESFSALTQYQAVIGAISSVLFEAMSLHKKVGRLNYNGLKAIETELLHGGTIINSPHDFDQFMKSPYNDEKDSKDLYSDFQPNSLKIVGL